MTDGLNLTGFNDVAPAVQHTIGEQYAAAPNAAFSASDVSSQGESGTTNKMVHTTAETSSFGTGK